LKTGHESHCCKKGRLIECGLFCVMPAPDFKPAKTNDEQDFYGAFPIRFGHDLLFVVAGQRRPCWWRGVCFCGILLN
jgi:hypothetical protein